MWLPGILRLCGGAVRRRPDSAGLDFAHGGPDFLGAVQLVSVGVLGEYIGRIFEQTRGMPRFVVVESDEPSPGGDDQIDHDVFDGE
jgi:hypothetical protein